MARRNRERERTGEESALSGRTEVAEDSMLRALLERTGSGPARRSAFTRASSSLVVRSEVPAGSRWPETLLVSINCLHHYG